MAIGTNDAIEKFGTQDTVSAGGGTALIASTNFSAEADGVDWVNDDDALIASAVLTADFASAPGSGTTIDLFCQLKDIDGTADSPLPGAGATVGNQHVFLGSFPVDSGYSTATFTLAIEIGLPNTVTSQVYRFFLRNNGGQQLDAGWVLKVTPKAIGPHPA